MIETGSLQENNQRLEQLYKNHDEWLRKVAYNLTSNGDVVQDLVQELYLYLAQKRNKDLYYLDSFNLKYCYAFIRSRYMNLINREKKNVYVGGFKEEPNEEYNDEWDKELERFEKEVLMELKELETTKMWPQAKIFKMYHFSDDTMEELSNKINISKSTTFLSLKRVKEHLKETIKKPIKPTEDGEL